MMTIWQMISMALSFSSNMEMQQITHKFDGLYHFDSTCAFSPRSSGVLSYVESVVQVCAYCSSKMLFLNKGLRFTANLANARQVESKAISDYDAMIKVRQASNAAQAFFLSKHMFERVFNCTIAQLRK